MFAPTAACVDLGALRQSKIIQLPLPWLDLQVRRRTACHRRCAEVRRGVRGCRDLVQFPCHEEGGLIFAVLDADSDVDIRAYLGAMMDDVAKKGMDQWTYVGHRIIHGPNWKVAYDGYLEGYHFKAAHPETIEPRTFS